MNPTRAFVSAFRSIVRSVRLAVFTPPPEELERPEPRDLICELFRYMPTRASDACLACRREERQSVLLREAPRSPQSSLHGDVADPVDRSPFPREARPSCGNCFRSWRPQIAPRLLWGQVSPSSTPSVPSNAR